MSVGSLNHPLSAWGPGPRLKGLSRKVVNQCGQASVQNDSTALLCGFSLQPEAGERVLCGGYPGPMHVSDGSGRASVFAHSTVSANRETVVNRLLDWAEEARARGRERRAENLVCLAWDAYDRL